MEKENKHLQVLQIKNMVCPRCIKVVQDDLSALGLEVEEVLLGSAIIVTNDAVPMHAIEAALKKNGFELLHDKREELVEHIKLAVIDLIYQNKLAALNISVSTYLADTLGKDYATLSTLFKAAEGVALSKYVILQKVEHAKELLTYNEDSISSIAAKLGYKSMQHLSSQFKEITGVSPNYYRKQGGLGRQTIDNLHVRLP
ncbi:AraC family transcriptional regulator [Pontibacter sp. E15-1]|uniref:helix-turn-helix domain-containing protein n=1 Tax=Pontibacter sp. E15-1 TaxID=2919918 RepID=UPI001F4FB627|nr:AraC family transcriptional regulator [Pontibacter sp. E15-1]MCJ8163369.1 AraC family transcriptional regulator [Pontibacter sp. E15-1]